jgi:hypothetical protein
VPDTLLLAEAFWLMEGYFVRTLGMHRVYNSAFMNMMRDEKNQEYRLVIKNTLEFDPEILKRYVNFMNNPDERTAVDQFGKGDKYFGVCTLMATLPGLPMLGHGQIEGFTEKYGMEYRRAYWDEQSDQYLVDRHAREIFPLLRRRYLFAEAHNFRLYDFYTPEGYVNEDVYAFSNRAGDQRALVVYHNKYANARGWIRTSAAFPIKHGEGERELVQVSLAEGLGLPHEAGMFVSFRDHITGLEYIRPAMELHGQGLYIELEAYSYHVFWEFKLIPDNAWRQYAQLAGYLNGRGVPSIDEALKEIFLQSIHDPYRELVNSGQISWLIEHRLAAGAPTPDLEPLLREIQEKALLLMQSVETYLGTSGSAERYALETRQQVERILWLPALGDKLPLPRSRKYLQALTYLQRGPTGSEDLSTVDAKIWGPLFAWCFTHDLAKAAPQQALSGSTIQEVSRTWLDEWLLGKMIAACLQDLSVAEAQSWRGVSAVRLLISHAGWFERLGKTWQTSHQSLQTWLKDQDVQRFIGVNRFQDVLWFNREAFDEFLWWMFAGSVAWLLINDASLAENPQAAARAIIARWEVIERLRQVAASSEYQLERLAALSKD